MDSGVIEELEIAAVADDESRVLLRPVQQLARRCARPRVCRRDAHAPRAKERKQLVETV
jgi:hypothetical protein